MKLHNNRNAWFKDEPNPQHGLGQGNRSEGGTNGSRKYRTFTSDQKAEIVLAGLRWDRSVRDVCREYEIAETLYYQWRDRLLDGGKQVLKTSRDKGRDPQAEELKDAKRRIGQLERALGRATTDLEIAGSTDAGSLPAGSPPGTDNGTQFTSRDFRRHLSARGITHRRGGYGDPESEVSIRVLVRPVQEALRLARRMGVHRPGPTRDHRLHRPPPQPTPLRDGLSHPRRSRNDLAGPANPSYVSRQRGRRCCVAHNQPWLTGRGTPVDSNDRCWEDQRQGHPRWNAAGLDDGRVASSRRWV